MITTIIFDLSEVFLHGLLGTEKLLAHKLQIEVPNTDFFVPELEQLFHGEISEAAYWDALIKKHGWNITVEELKKLIRQNFHEIDGTRGVLEDLKVRIYKMGLLSVHAKEWIEYCESKFGYHKFFDVVEYSFQDGVCKPDSRAYIHILESLESKPTEALFIDDSATNLATARKLGMTTIQFTNAKKLKEELEYLNL